MVNKETYNKKRRKNSVRNKDLKKTGSRLKNCREIITKKYV